MFSVVELIAVAAAVFTVEYVAFALPVIALYKDCRLSELKVPSPLYNSPIVLILLGVVIALAFCGKSAMPVTATAVQHKHDAASPAMKANLFLDGFTKIDLFIIYLPPD